MESQETEFSIDSSALYANEDNSSTTSSGNSTAVTALEELQELFTTDPNTERVSFRGRKFSQTEAEAALTFVQTHFPRLRHLDLRDNDLYELPRDFGARLPKLVALNLLNNNFRFRNGALRTLAETLQGCPCLKSLSLSLSSPAEEQMLLAMLPRLRILNGTPLPSTSSAPQRSTKNSIRPKDLPASISDDRTDWCKLLKLNRSQVSNSEGSTVCSETASSAVSTLSTAVPTEAFLQQLKAVVKAFHECDSLGKTNNNSKVKLFSQLDRHVELLAQQLKRQEPDDGKTELSEAMLQTRWSLLELLDLIHCVYASKVKYDDRAITAGAPRETIEQHLYTYLNTRFGLPKLIVDYASAVWKAAEHFARRENDAAVFVALLRNRLDEGFLDIKRKLQSAIVELLRAFFTARHPKKQGKAIAALVQNRMDDLLQEEEWRNLLTYLYEPQDSATLLRLVQQKAEKYQTLQLQRQKPQPNEKPSLALPFTDFEQVLYGYQLQGRLDLLDNFRRAFEELDTDRVGVIGRPECAVTKLVETLDPFNHDVITFSDAANALLPDIRRANTKTDSTTTSQSKIKKITS
ncbi:hypothetical protein BBO99_00003024 [Phytophthora kernoviae]|uniref:EF-hand domain-containing protein n=2 Tax=Phytophthora kernoviae TaxID=325452 RepID=A0A3R7H1W7_9STRA|nr:hypothetical protein G195_003485 [Phytophthora kernoviae 00238/432]KAG2529060.1 hypothetical protein JM18_002570 [Phytophthora kernoviae]RLN10128.1 hypothetical protein BBI17_003088 [Phytophthora kernoviae]RLN82307.1 hypothetical protein BBO99_00003024 [Phytophthora kernoviae]